MHPYNFAKNERKMYNSKTLVLEQYCVRFYWNSHNNHSHLLSQFRLTCSTVLSVLINLYSPWNIQKAYGFLMISGVMEIKFGEIHKCNWKVMEKYTKMSSFLITLRSSHQRCSMKKPLKTCNFIKETPTQVFSCERLLLNAPSCIF